MCVILQTELTTILYSLVSSCFLQKFSIFHKFVVYLQQKTPIMYFARQKINYLFGWFYLCLLLPQFLLMLAGSSQFLRKLLLEKIHYQRGSPLALEEKAPFEVGATRPSFLLHQIHHDDVALCKVAREVVGGGRGPIVIIVEAIQCKVDQVHILLDKAQYGSQIYQFEHNKCEKAF